MAFHGESLSQDSRLHILLKLAIRNLINVHTLRIVYGHWNLTSVLLAGLLDPDRPQRIALRKLWLESCHLSTDSIQHILPGRAIGLESLRIRRLRCDDLDTIQSRDMRNLDFRLSRGGHFHQMHNGSGGWTMTTVYFPDVLLPDSPPHPSDAELKAKGAAYDAVMWEGLSDIRDYIDANQAQVVDQGALAPPVEPMHWLFSSSAFTLTSINLDWVLFRRKDNDPYDSSSSFLRNLQRLRFPNLRAFQIRNAVLPLTKLPDDVFLLETTFLEFMEAHSKIQCLGWPLDKIYSHVKPSIETQIRSRKLVAHLAMMLTDLRIDTQYAGHGEPLTDDSTTTEERLECVRRRRFITEFVPHLRKIEQIKLEGGIPRDEKREILRALHWCPLKKIVMIGVSFPVGNTWGAQGHYLKAVDPGQHADFNYNLEEEDRAALLASYRRHFRVLPNYKFEPQFGWSASTPLLQTMASHHSRTVEEIKICGYNGCPILSSQTNITGPLMIGLRNFSNLKQLVISVWLLTWYENSYRDEEIIQSWMDTRSAASKALVIVPPPVTPPREHPVDPGHFPNVDARAFPRQDFNRWAVALKTRFSPPALAYRVAQDIGPYLSPIAKARPGGVRVRASFCLGQREERRSANDIFDLDLRVGQENQVLEFIGPREEGEKGRWWTKLEGRRWF